MARMSATPEKTARTQVGGLCRTAVRSCLLTLLAANALAQTPACDQLKDTLAKRLPADMRGYSMEAVPANTPETPGTKVIGTCEAGAYKVLYRRWGGAVQASAGTASVARPLPASAPVAAPKPALPPVAATPAPPAARQQPVNAVGSSASEAAAVANVERPVAVPQAQRDETAAPQERPSRPAPGFMTESMAEFTARYWQWILALVVFPVAGLLWFWLAHRRAYDEAGLPRGPRL